MGSGCASKTFGREGGEGPKLLKLAGQEGAVEVFLMTVFVLCSSSADLAEHCCCLNHSKRLFGSSNS